jgi:hypothetical protein
MIPLDLTDCSVTANDGFNMALSTISAFAATTDNLGGGLMFGWDEQMNPVTPQQFFLSITTHNLQTSTHPADGAGEIKAHD